MERIKSLEEYQERVCGWERRVAPYTTYISVFENIFKVIFADWKLAELFYPQMNTELCSIRNDGDRNLRFIYYSGQGLKPYQFPDVQSYLLDMQVDRIRTVERWFEINAPGVNPWAREVL